jgi:exosortase/archaeosortase family protein
MKKFLGDPLVKFLFFGFSLYLIWLGSYEWWLHPAGMIDRVVISNTLFFSQRILEWMGYVVVWNGERWMYIKGTPGLFIGDSCNGISLFALFSIFIIAFPGKQIAKLFFIPIGVLLIHLLNVLRVVVLAVIQTYSYAWTEFNHTYTFTIIMYFCIFALWMIWINKFSGLRKKHRTETSLRERNDRSNLTK